MTGLNGWVPPGKHPQQAPPSQEAGLSPRLPLRPGSCLFPGNSSVSVSQGICISHSPSATGRAPTSSKSSFLGRSLLPSLPMVTLNLLCQKPQATNSPFLLCGGLHWLLHPTRVPRSPGGGAVIGPRPAPSAVRRHVVTLANQRADCGSARRAALGGQVTPAVHLQAEQGRGQTPLQPPLPSPHRAGSPLHLTDGRHRRERW